MCESKDHFCYQALKALHAVEMDTITDLNTSKGLHQRTEQFWQSLTAESRQDAPAPTVNCAPRPVREFRRLLVLQRSQKGNAETSAQNPGQPISTPSRYVQMLLQLDQIPSLHNLLAGLFTWLLLAGYVVLPGTFTSLKRLDGTSGAAHSNPAEKVVLSTVQNAPLLWIAATIYIVGASGLLWLWWKWKDNYVWLVNRIFL